MKIPAFSPTIRRKEMDAVLSCLVSEKIGPGDMNARLAVQVKEFFSVEGALALRSPAIALKYILLAMDLSKEGGVMLSALAPQWQYATVAELGYRPIVLDVQDETPLAGTAAIEEGIKNGGRLLVYHETFGFLPDFDQLAQFGIPVVEDLSQSAGGRINGALAGTFGVFSILGLEEQDILTAGGGAVVLAPRKREATVLKKHADAAPTTDILPDINSALASVQLKELPRNAAIRAEMHSTYVRSLLQGRHKTFVQSGEHIENSVYSFPVLLASGFKEVKQYADRKEIGMAAAFEKSIVAALHDELDSCKNARSLLLRCALFPLYPLLGKSHAEKIARVLATLP